MARLTAFVNPVGLTPAFLIPLFADPPQRNVLLVQRLSPDGYIESFDNFDVIPSLLMDMDGRPPIEVVDGDGGIWAFAFDDTDIMVGQSSELTERLRDALSNGQFSERPFLAVEIAQFCEEDGLYREALTKAFQAHHTVSALGAEIWRDIVVLRPALQREVLSLMPKSRHGLAVHLDEIDVRVSDGVANIFVLEDVYHAALMHRSVILPGFELLAQSFGIHQVHIRMKERVKHGSEGTPAHVSTATRPYYDLDSADPNAVSINRNFLYLSAFGTESLRSMLHMAAHLKRNDPPLRPLVGKTLALLFHKLSTRTRVSFEVGIRQLGGDVVVLSARDMQGAGTDIDADNARLLSRYVDAIVVVTDNLSTLHSLARYASVPVINARTSSSHPCQLMADVMTFEEHRGPIADQVIAWCGDGNHIARTWIEAAVRFNFVLRLATPDALRPPQELIDWALAQGGKIELTDDPEKAVSGSRCVVTDTWETIHDVPNANRYRMLEPFRVTSALMAKAAPDALFMHSLPARRGDEVTADVIDGPQSVVFDEAENRMHAQKGILAWVFRKSSR